MNSITEWVFEGNRHHLPNFIHVFPQGNRSVDLNLEWNAEPRGLHPALRPEAEDPH